MGRINLVIFVLLIPVLLVYNNCSKSSGDLSGGSALSSVNGSESLGFSGKLQLEHFTPQPNCSSDWVSPIEVLELDATQKSARVEWNRCLDQGEAGIVLNQVQRQPYNSYLAVYNNKIYASPILHEGIDDYLYYLEYCYNDLLQMDFTIQYALIDVPGMAQPIKDWIGVLMNGPLATLPGLQFNGGYMEFASNGSKVFKTDNGTYSVEITPASTGGKKQAILTKANGTKIPMQCWFDPQI